MKLLIIEDDQCIIDAIIYSFQVGWKECQIMASNRGNEGLEVFEKENPDIVILDLGLPDIDGFRVIQEIRKYSKIPILVLTVRNDESYVIKALELGANEYVEKPFRSMELLARVKSLVRGFRDVQGIEPISYGPITLDDSQRTVTIYNKKTILTAIESQILFEILKKAPEVVSYNVLSNKISGGYFPDTIKTIKVHIRHIREKIEHDPSNPKYILNRIGLGYYASQGP
ncbi:MAG: response regulator transcription factor [Dehalogenimonas sp.]